jgi:phage shock protein A
MGSIVAGRWQLESFQQGEALMKFLDRALRLVRADAHGVMDQLEERSLLLKQHLREAEVEITRKRVRLEALEDEEMEVAQEATRRERQHALLDEDVELALAGDKEDLARFAVKRLLPVRDALRSLQERGDAIRRERARLAERLMEQQEQFEELRQEVASRLASGRREKAAREASDGASPACGGDSVLDGQGGRAADEEVELELLRRRGLATAGASEGCA